MLWGLALHKSNEKVYFFIIYFFKFFILTLRKKQGGARLLMSLKMLWDHAHLILRFCWEIILDKTAKSNLMFCTYSKVRTKSHILKYHIGGWKNGPNKYNYFMINTLSREHRFLLVLLREIRLYKLLSRFLCLLFSARHLFISAGVLFYLHRQHNIGVVYAQTIY